MGNWDYDKKTAQVRKEYAFINLGAKVLPWTRADKKAYLNAADNGIVMSDKVWEWILRETLKVEELDMPHCDLSDGTEAKTSSVYLDSTGRYPRWCGAVRGVGLKTGYNRTAIYNFYMDEIHHALFPPKGSKGNLLTYTGEGRSQRICFNFSPKKEEYTWWFQEYITDFDGVTVPMLGTCGKKLLIQEKAKLEEFFA